MSLPDPAVWKLKKQIRALTDTRGNGSSVISLIIPPGDQISRVQKLLIEESGTAVNIKSRVNRLSVMSAIGSAQQLLKQYSRVPDNGLAVYSGTVLDSEGKDKRIVEAIQPHKKINTSLYMCDNRFHTESLLELFESDDKYGFIIIDGNGYLFGVLSGNAKTVLFKEDIELPNKQGRGGQSQLRFERIRREKRHNYVRKVAEELPKFFITDEKVNVKGLIVAGQADFKTVLSESDLLDPRLKKSIIKLIDMSYGMERGFETAIQMSSDVLSEFNVTLEKKEIERLFNEIAKDSGLSCYGFKETLEALESGAVDTLLLYEHLELKFIEDDGSQVNLVEYMSENYRQYGCRLVIVSDATEIGTQFCKGFGGVGALLRYKTTFVGDSVVDQIETEDKDETRPVEEIEANFM